MDLQQVIQKFSSTREDQQKAIFNTLFILTNRLQTLFDNHIPDITLKQFMLLSLIKECKQPLTLTKLGEMLGCTRQNIKKTAVILEKKGFVNIQQNPNDNRTCTIAATNKLQIFFDTEFLKYQAALQSLYTPYSNEEVATLFQLLTKLYQGINCLQGTIKEKNNE